MQAQRLNITLPYESARDFKRLIPAKERSKFIAKALKEKLPRRDLKKELVRSLKINKEFYKKVAREIDEDFKYADAEVWKKLP